MSFLLGGNFNEYNWEFLKNRTCSGKLDEIIGEESTYSPAEIKSIPFFVPKFEVISFVLLFQVDWEKQNILDEIDAPLILDNYCISIAVNSCISEFGNLAKEKVIKIKWK